MRRWVTRYDQPTLDEVLDEPITRRVLASNGLARDDMETAIANLRRLLPDRGRGVTFRLSLAPPAELGGTARTSRRKEARAPNGTAKNSTAVRLARSVTPWAPGDSVQAEGAC